ncbi:MAG: tryptophan 2,3-dioxygenase family protein [Azospirillaceae bacterium]
MTDDQASRTYGDFLQLKTLLNLQDPMGGKHDAHLFVIIHQVKELWMKLIFVELEQAIAQIRDDRLAEFQKTMARVKRIQEQLIDAWSTMATLTPWDYLTFRPYLGTSSGFQSWGYRKLEFLLGQKNRAYLKPHAHDPEVTAELEDVLARPSLYDEALICLARRGYPVPPDLLDRDWREPYTAHPGVEAVWKTVYEDAPNRFEEYALGETLVDTEYYFQLWRFKHLKTVERVIGFKRGTGGSPGVPYLKSALDKYFYPELWTVRTALETGDET